MPKDAEIDTKWPRLEDEKPMFSLQLKNNEEVMMNGTFDKDTGKVTVQILEQIAVKSYMLFGKHIAEELVSIWQDKNWTLVAQVVKRSDTGLEKAPDRVQKKGDGKGSGGGKGKKEKRGSKGSGKTW